MDENMVIPNQCTVCDTKVEQNYCPNCGQLKAKRETTFFTMLYDVLANLIDIERSVLLCTLKVIKQPRLIIENYWAGHRNYYPSPGKILLYALAVAVLHLTYVSPGLLGASVSIDGFEDTQIAFWVIFLPFLTLTSYFSFIRKKHSITKHFVSVLYISASLFIILTVVADVFLLIIGDFGQEYVVFLFLLLVFILNAIVMNKVQSISKIVLGTSIQVGVLLILVAIAVILLLLTSDDGVTFGNPLPESP